MASDLAIIGAGYVGLPLAVAFAEAGRHVHCVDTDTGRVQAIEAGRSPIADVPSQRLAAWSSAGCSRPPGDYAAVAEADAI